MYLLGKESEGRGGEKGMGEGVGEGFIYGLWLFNIDNTGIYGKLKFKIKNFNKKIK